MSTNIFDLCLFCRQRESQNMEPVKVLAILQFLTNKFITQADIAEALGITKSAVNKKLMRDSHFRPGEIEQIEKHFGVNFSDFKLATPNTFERQNDTTVNEKSSQFGKRLSLVQEKHNFLDREMAKLLKISEDEYIDLVCGDKEPDLQILNCIKQNFKVSIDYLLYGD